MLKTTQRAGRGEPRRKCPGRSNRLDQAVATLRKVTESPLLDDRDQDELDSLIQQTPRELQAFVQLEKALDAADVHAVEEYMTKSIEELS
jgi:hypothetical protein